jgi:alkylation response protein AidB-like acyl-CoA dehydrogenase
MALGIARSALEALVGLAIEKRHERTGQSLGEDRGAQARLAEAEALVRSARLFLFDSANNLWDEMLAVGKPSAENLSEVRLASVHAVTSAAQAVDLVYITGGTTSLYKSFPIERAFRDVHAITQHIGAHPRNLESAGKVLFGLEPDPPMI